MKFVDNAKDWWKWFSMWAMAIAGAIQGTWAILDDEMRKSIPHYEIVVPALTVIILVLGVFGRVVDQTKKQE